MKLDLSEILILFTVAQLFLFSFILILLKSNRKISNNLLGLFFLSLILNVSNLLLFRVGGFAKQYVIYLLYLGSPFAFLYAPLFYLYLRSLTTTNYKFKLLTFFHGFPFIILFAYILFAYTLRSGEEKKEILDTGGIFSHIWYIILTAILHIQVIFYFIISFRRIAFYKRRIRNFSSSGSLANLNWIRSIIGGLICLWLIDFSRYLTGLYSKNIKSGIEIFLFLGFIIFCYYFIYKALKQPLLLINTENSGDTKKKSLSQLSYENYLQKLVGYMEKARPYLNAELTLLDLSKNCGIPVRSLSEVIKKSFGCNFYDFVNLYRIKESEKLLSSSDFKKTILEVLFEAGFNSKSSFNKAFKKQKGMTPSEFRRNFQYSTMLEAG